MVSGLPCFLFDFSVGILVESEQEAQEGRKTKFINIWEHTFETFGKGTILLLLKAER